MRFVQGIDYGLRKGTLGFAVHMAEGGDGTLAYLARRAGESDSAWRTRVRGVSANFVILSTGEIVQMVLWSRASGSMNPADRSTEKAFYGRRFLVAALGTHAVDPNAYSLSVEITGYRNVGPNQAQVEALVRLVEMARARYPGMVGAYGHADQTDTKGCPGTAPLMLEAWQRIGHGAFRPAPLPDTSTGDDIVKVYTIPGPQSSGSWPASTPVYPGPTGPSSGATTVARRYLMEGQDHPTAPNRYLVNGSGGAEASAGMAWLPVKGMTAKQDETWEGGKAATIAAARGATR